jgi:hypothetical protein
MGQPTLLTVTLRLEGGALAFEPPLEKVVNDLNAVLEAIVTQTAGVPSIESHVMHMLGLPETMLKTLAHDDATLQAARLQLFELLERHPERVMALDPELIEQVIYDSIRGKAEVVALDEKEGGLRSTLNWGHTIGHAVEALKSPEMMHGECVSVGCVAEAEVAMRLGRPDQQLDASKIARITACFASYGLPVHVPRGLPIEMLMKKMALDKKNRGTTIRCTVVTDIGISLEQPQPCPKDIMEAVMAESMAEGLKHPEWVPHKGNHGVAAAGGQMAK